MFIVYLGILLCDNYNYWNKFKVLDSKQNFLSFPSTKHNLSNFGKSLSIPSD